jgi:uncharacterized membrane protein
MEAKPENTANIKLALEEMRLLQEKQFESGDTLDQKANILLGTTGLIFTIVSTLQISLSSSSTHSPLYWIIEFLALIYLVILILFSINIIGPQTYKTGLIPDKEIITREIILKSENDALLGLISGYIDQIKHNYKINQKKSKLVRLGLIILLSVIIFLLLLTFIK